MNIKYSNKLNLVGISSLNKIENSIFFAILHKLKNEKDMLSLPLTDLKISVGIGRKSNDYVKQVILKMAEKLSRVSVEDTSNDDFTRFFAVFEVLEVPNKEPMLRVKLSNPFLHIVNDVKSEFTTINFEKYIKFSSKYTQTLYRYLRQWLSTGKYYVKVKDFRKNLGIPDTYEMCEINRLILKKAKKEFELLGLFENLTIKKITSNTRGKPVTHLEFHFPAGDNSFNKAQAESNSIPTTQAQAQANVNREKLLDNQKAKAKTKERLKADDDFCNFVGRNFWMRNKYEQYESCKIIELHKDNYGNIVGNMYNQDSDSYFEMEFESVRHIQNALDFI